jgi:hypothetical protein
MWGPRAKRLKWVEEQRRRAEPLTEGDWVLLRILAALADECGCVSFRREDLADRIALSLRATQYSLRRLEAAGLMKATGRSAALRGSTGRVPVYQLGPVSPRAVR